MMGTDGLAPFKVGNRARHLEDARIGSRAESERCKRLSQKGFRLCIQRAEARRHAACELRVKPDPFSFITQRLHAPRSVYPRAHGFGASPALREAMSSKPTSLIST